MYILVNFLSLCYIIINHRNGGANPQSQVYTDSPTANKSHSFEAPRASRPSRPAVCLFVLESVASSVCIAVQRLVVDWLSS